MSEPLLQPFRALGYITDEVPFTVHRRGKETWVTFSVGRNWQVYNTAKLSLVLVGPQLSARISALEAKGEYTYAASGTSIVVCKRVHVCHTWVGHSSPVLQLMIFGEFLVSLGSDGKLCLWKLDMSSAAPWKTIDLSEGFRPTCMAHPPTYINKLLVGGADGSIQLWNINTENLIYTFAGWGSRVCCIEPSPALDVVGVGLADGTAVVVNVKYDEVLMKFANASGVGAATEDLLARGAGVPLPGSAGGAACTCLSFRTGTGPPLMAAAGGSGAITVWHLDQRKLQTVIKDAHVAEVTRLHFFPGEPVLMSSGADNAVKQHIFDNSDGSARLLRFRAGHCAPPRLLQFYGPEGTVILSAAEDQELRAFSVIQDQQSRALSQLHTKRRAKRLKILESELKLPVAVSMAASSNRERDWSNVLTAHAGDPVAYAWQLPKYRLSDVELAPPPRELLDGSVPAPVTAVCVSQCGNFGFVGSAEGRVDRYNMQSGIHRGQYCRKDPDDPDAVLRAHEGAVVGLGCDACNRLVVSLSHTGHLHSWDFKSRRLNAELSFDCSVSRLYLHAHSMLAAVACGDNVVRVVDVQQAIVVRQFRGHTDRLNDVHISDDGKWVLSASMDGTVRVWDVPASSCLQALRLGCPVTSLALSPNLELLATAHAGRRGIYLWANQLLFGASAGITPSDAIVNVGLPSVSTGRTTHSQGDFEAATAPDSDFDDYDSDDQSSSEMTLVTSGDLDGNGEASIARGSVQVYNEVEGDGAPKALGRDLLTLCGESVSRWEALVHLDAIKARNRPTKPAEKPESAPFFLPSAETLPGQNGAASQLLTDAFAPESLRMAGTDLAERGDAEGDDTDAGPGPGTLAVSAQVLRVKDLQTSAWRESPFMQLLDAGVKAGDFTSATTWLREASPVMIERAVRSVELVPPFEEDEVAGASLLLMYILAQLESARCFDSAQGLLSLILRIHGDGIAENPRLMTLASRIHRQLTQAWAQVDEDIHAVRCMISLFSNTQM